jgi:hypothetical protein
MNINFIRSKVFLGIACALFGCALLAASFGIGELIGYQKAHFSYAWGEQYDQNFGGPSHGIFGAPGAPRFMDAHGTFGVVLKVDETSLIVRGADNREKIIVTDARTQFEGATTVLVHDRVVVIGTPNAQGQILATFIRILPLALPIQ